MHTPVALVRSMALMLPRLEAEESLLTLTRLAIGVGSMGQRRALSTIDAWTAMAGLSSPTGSPRRVAGPEVLADMGIGLTVVTKDAAGG